MLYWNLANTSLGYNSIRNGDSNREQKAILLISLFVIGLILHNA